MVVFSFALRGFGAMRATGNALWHCWPNRPNASVPGSTPTCSGPITTTQMPEWLTDEVLGLCGGRSRAEQRAALRAYTEEAVREGLAETPWEQLIGGSDSRQPGLRSEGIEEVAPAGAGAIRRAAVASADAPGTDRAGRRIGEGGGGRRFAIGTETWGGTWRCGWDAGGDG